MANINLPNKDRLRWQCRRGMLELELFLNDFLENDYENLSTDKKSDFVDLLKVIDPVLFDYLMGTDEPDDHGLRDIVQTIRTATRQRVSL
ncbi:succinate dehydrogenase assembly factor 2 [sulfur-oxidizing endosymbiont of Gigantopelta aegis]|uniref:FAD assembly factor SdhE n=1 Tax=sulfur-oxidizing endosymbiont of Gigantopelta aegis TaxID=2794934 RepID=UPI0018DCD071|nr:succinate dehydrogenase assembly factor 2 [sulfur-oxidizing endosymbiont of Gigantopelta aegis]